MAVREIDFLSTLLTVSLALCWISNLDTFYVTAFRMTNTPMPMLCQTTKIGKSRDRHIRLTGIDDQRLKLVNGRQIGLE